MDYAALLKKIDDFIRRFYLNKIVRGSIWLCLIFMVGFLLLISLEYFEYLSVGVKTFLFYSFFALQLILFWFLIGRHLLHYFRLGKAIDHHQAAAIIGDHFPEIKDRLTNTLQLQNALSDNPAKRELIIASINQRVQAFQPIPFVSAVKIRNNKKYLRFAIAPLAVIIVIAIAAPAILTDGTSRFIQHDVQFEKKAPFEFHVKNTSMEATEGEDFLFQLRLSGNEVPQDIYLEDGKNSFKLKKEDLLNFNHLFKNIQEDKNFRLHAGEFYSPEYELKVYKKPVLLKLQALVDYPDYLQRKNEELVNPGDFSVPEGAHIKWIIQTQNASGIDFQLGDSSILVKQSENQFIADIKIRKSANYSILPKNQAKGEKLSHQINVVLDAFPKINVEQKPDSTNKRVLYFIGDANDDYGISRITLVYTITKSPDEKRINKTFRLPVKYNSARKAFADFFYFWPLQKTDISPEEELNYYFEVADNDGINGPKVSRSQSFYYQLPSKSESFQLAESKTEKIGDKIKKASQQAKEIQEEAKKLTMESLNSTSLDYNQQKKVEQLVEKQNRLEKLLDEISKENKQSLLERKQLEDNKSLQEKQQQIQELFENVLDEKTKELLSNLQKLMDEKNAVNKPQDFQDVQVNNKALEKELDRILELYKKLEVEQKINKNIEKLNDLAAEQQESIENKSPDKQREINKDFQDIKKDLKEISEKDQQLENSTGFKNPEEQVKKTEEELNKALDNLQKGNNSKSAESQKNAAQQMQQMAKSLQQMMAQESGQEIQVNERELRQLLKNLLQSSFDQEKLMLQLRNINANDGKMVEIGQQQRTIVDKLKIVEDSLYSLSKRVPQIASTVNKEISMINSQLTGSLQNITERKISEANRQQQYALTAINNLALLLSDALKQLQSAMKSGNSGGKGKPQPGFGELSKMQQELSENMQKAREQMKQQGIQPGKSGQGNSSKQFAEMARQQQMIRQALQKLQQEMNKGGEGKSGEFEKTLKEMEQTETELVNKRLTDEALLRQKNITIKLLEAEKAEQEREQDQAKESKTGKEFAPDYDIILKEYQELRNKNLHMLKSMPPSLKSFYKLKISKYLEKLNLEE